MGEGRRRATARAGSTGTAPSTFRYAGGLLDSAGLYHFGERYYDPMAMRWTQPDPLGGGGSSMGSRGEYKLDPRGRATDLNDGNLYLYAGADPINRRDPTGLFDVLDAMEVGAAVAVTGIACGTAATGVGAALCVAGAAGTSAMIGNKLQDEAEEDEEEEDDDDDEDEDED